MLGRLVYYWPPILLVAVFLGIWEGVMVLGWVSIIYIAAPSGIAEASWEFLFTGEIWEQAYVSLLRFAFGLAIGSGIGIVVGVLTGWFEPIRRSFEPLINAVYGTPKIAILPLLVLLMGIGETPKVALIAFTAFFPLWMNTHAGMRNVETLLVRVARSFGANKRQVLLKVGLPSVVPYIAAGFRLGAGHALVMVIAAEFLAAKSGLGHLINEAGEAYQLERLLSLIFLFGIICFFLMRSVALLERKVAPWRAEQGK